MFPLRAYRRECNGQFLPCLRVSVVAALPSSPLPTAGLCRCGGFAACLLMGLTEGRGASLLSLRAGRAPRRRRPLRSAKRALSALRWKLSQKRSVVCFSGVQVASVLEHNLRGTTPVRVQRVVAIYRGRWAFPTDLLLCGVLQSSHSIITTDRSITYSDKYSVYHWSGC